MQNRLVKVLVAVLILASCGVLYSVYQRGASEGIVTVTENVVQKGTKTVLIYTKAGCIYCEKAINLLRNERITYTEQDVTGDMDKRRSLIAVTGARTVPYIFVGHKYIGGYTDFARMIRNKELPDLKREEHQ